MIRDALGLVALLATVLILLRFANEEARVQQFEQGVITEGTQLAGWNKACGKLNYVGSPSPESPPCAWFQGQGYNIERIKQAFADFRAWIYIAGSLSLMGLLGVWYMRGA